MTLSAIWLTTRASGATTLLALPGAAVAPFFQREEPGLAAAADAVFTPAVESHGDGDRMTQALENFHAVLRTALEPPAPAARWRALRRRRRAV